MPSQRKFMFDLLVMFIACNLPLYLLDRQPFQHFWNTYNPKWKLPSRRKLQAYVRVEIENKIKSELTNKELRVCLDKTTDFKQNSIVNILVCVLDPSKPTAALLSASKRLEKCTSTNLKSQQVRF